MFSTSRKTKKRNIDLFFRLSFARLNGIIEWTDDIRTIQSSEWATSLGIYIYIYIYICVFVLFASSLHIIICLVVWCHHSNVMMTTSLSAFKETRFYIYCEQEMFTWPALYLTTSLPYQKLQKVSTFCSTDRTESVAWKSVCSEYFKHACVMHDVL